MSCSVCKHATSFSFALFALLRACFEGSATEAAGKRAVVGAAAVPQGVGAVTEMTTVTGLAPGSVAWSVTVMTTATDTSRPASPREVAPSTEAAERWRGSLLILKMGERSPLVLRERSGVSSVGRDEGLWIQVSAGVERSARIYEGFTPAGETH